MSVSFRLNLPFMDPFESLYIDERARKLGEYDRRI
jgi:hypothetical protein